MFRIMKSQLAEFSYFLEKYFGITSIVWSILFIAGACALIGIAISKTVEIIYKKKKHKDCSFLSLYLLLTGITGFVMNVLVSQAYTWDSKLQRVMQNYQYIMAFDSNRRAVFKALSLPDNVVNRNSVFSMAMYFNGKHWDVIKNAVGDGGWYFAKVQKAITEILRIGDCHMSLGVIYQGTAAFVPIILIAAIGLTFMIKKKVLPGVLILALSLMCILGNLGAGIYVLTALLLGLAVDKWLDVSLKNMEKKLKKQKEKMTAKPAE